MFSRMRHTTSVTPASDMSSMGMEKYQSLVKNVTTGDVSASMRKPQQVRGETDRTRFYRFYPLYRALRVVARGKPGGPGCSKCFWGRGLSSGFHAERGNQGRPTITRFLG